MQRPEQKLYFNKVVPNPILIKTWFLHKIDICNNKKVTRTFKYRYTVGILPMLLPIADVTPFDGTLYLHINILVLQIIWILVTVPLKIDCFKNQAATVCQ